MGDCDPGIRYEFLEPYHRVVYRLHAVVHVVDLTLAQHLPADRCGYRILIRWPHVGQDRMPVLWWGPDARDVPYPGQSHLERSRYRRRGERQDINTRTQLTKCIFRLDTESLLLIDHDKAEPGELEIAR